MLDIAFKQRIVGAIFILSLGVILIPVILETPDKDSPIQYSLKPQTPSLPKNQGVAHINYVFNDMPANIEQPPQVVADAASEVVPVAEAPKQPEVVEKVAPKVAPKAAPKIAAKSSEPTRSAQALSEKTKSTVAVTRGDWTVQLGAFSSRDNAKNLQQRLAKAGFDAYLKEVPGSALVRVFVANGVARDDAQDLLSKLDSQYGLKGIIVRYR